MTLTFCKAVALSVALACLVAFAGETAAWKNAAGDLNPGDWSKGGIWKLAAWPGKDEIVASMRSQGLFSTKDGGATWKRMGEPGKTSPAKAGQAVQFVFDPKNKDTFWTSGMYGYGVWVTTDGGATFSPLGKFPNNHAEGIAVDFTDPERKTLLVGLHEQVNSLHKSVDGGKTWVKIGDKIPPETNFTHDPIIVDSKTFLIDCGGWKKDVKSGIFRSTDAGETWTEVSNLGPWSNPVVTTKGDIFWNTLWEYPLIVSRDKGLTWEKVGGPVRGRISELPGGRLVGLGGSQVYLSKDDGKTWAPIGEPVPFKPIGIVYNDVRKALYVWQNAKAPTPDMVMCWDVPAEILEAK